MSGIIGGAGSKSGVVGDKSEIRQIVTLKSVPNNDTTSNVLNYGGSFNPKGTNGVMICQADTRLNYTGHPYNHHRYAYYRFYTGGSVSSGVFSGGTNVYDSGVLKPYGGGGYSTHGREIVPCSFQFPFTGWSPTTDYSYVLYIVADSGTLVCDHMSIQIIELTTNSGAMG